MRTKTTETTKEMKQVVIRVPEEVHRALKIRAAEEGRSIGVIVEGLIREYLTKGVANE